MRIVTLNVRNPSFDNGPNGWPCRRAAFFEVLRGLDPDVLCLQETIVDHTREIMAEMPFRCSYGAPREDAISEGEVCAILRRESTPTSGSGTEWLCETPHEIGALGWDAVCPRVMTWVDFGDWLLINTHLDHIGKEARRNGMAQIIARANALGKPCLIVGDLNATPDEPALELARAAGFADLADGTGPTYHGFGKEPEIKIDYILARGSWRCERAWVERGDYSDHWAVATDVELA